MKKRMILFSLVTIMFISIPGQAFCKPLKVCLNQSTGAISAKKRCVESKGESEFNQASIQQLGISKVGPQGVPGPQGPQGLPGEQGPVGNDSVLCYAYIGFDGTVRSFGGRGTTDIVVSHAPNSGIYNITCQGSYPGIASGAEVSQFATIQTSSAETRSITTQSFGAVSSTSLTVQVRTFDPANVPTDYSHSILVLGNTSS